MTEDSKSTNLPFNNVRLFRLHLSNLYAAGCAAWEAAEDAARDAAWDVARETARDTAEEAARDAAEDAALEAAGGAAGEAAWDVAREAAREAARDAALDVAREAAWDIARYAAEDAAGDAAGDAARAVANKGGTTRQIVYASCLSVILNRKKIYASINSLGEKISSKSITIKEATKYCIIMMSFDEKMFAQLQLTIPLKMLDYLLGYEQMISFLRCDGGTSSYHSLMNSHSQLVRRLGLEKSYSELTAPRYGVSVLVEHLPTLPLVLLEIIVGYGYLCQDNPEDLDEIYDRLLEMKLD